MKTKQLNIGANKGKPRLWIEGAFLTDAGFRHGMEYIIKQYGDFLTITGEPKDDHGLRVRRIAGKPDRPIIDITGKTVSGIGNSGDRVSLETNGDRHIIISKL